MPDFILHIFFSCLSMKLLFDDPILKYSQVSPLIFFRNHQFLFLLAELNMLGRYISIDFNYVFFVFIYGGDQLSLYLRKVLSYF